MPLPAFDRGLVVVRPHGQYIASGRKTILVKSKHYGFAGERLLVIEQKEALAVIRLGEPREISLTEFRRVRSRHLVSEAERRRWWPTKTKFWLFPVVSRRKLKHPIPVEYPNGAQVTVRKKNVQMVR